MKKYGFMLLFALLLFAFPQIGHAAESAITITLDGEPLRLPEQVKVETISNNIMVPLRVVVENLGYKVTWVQATQSISVHNETRKVGLTLGKAVAVVDGVDKKLPVAPVSQGGSSLVPLRFVSETMGLTVDWNNKDKVVAIKNPAPAAKPKDVATANLASVEAISFSDNRLMLAISGSVEPKAFTMTGPDRIVVELPNTRFSSNFNQSKAGDTAQSGKLAVTDDAMLSSVRYSLFTTTPSTVRIVLDLKRATPYAMTKSGDKNSSVVMIGLDGQSLPDSSETPVVPIDTGSGTETGTGTGTGTDTPPQPTDQPVGEGTANPNPDPSASPDPALPGSGSLPSSGQTPNNGQSLPAGKHLVVLDAGHGQHDPGAIGVTDHKEKDFNLAMVLKVAELLKQDAQFEVVLTRSDDTFVELGNRAPIANNLNAAAFISIHANTGPSQAVGGSESYYYHPNGKSLADVLQTYLVQATGFKDRKVKLGDLRVLRDSKMPAALLEVGFLSNKQEEATMFNEEWQRRVAAGIVEGIKQYFAQAGAQSMKAPASTFQANPQTPANEVDSPPVETDFLGIPVTSSPGPQ